MIYAYKHKDGKGKAYQGNIERFKRRYPDRIVSGPVIINRLPDRTEMIDPETLEIVKRPPPVKAPIEILSEKIHADTATQADKDQFLRLLAKQHLPVQRG